MLAICHQWGTQTPVYLDNKRKKKVQADKDNFLWPKLKDMKQVDCPYRRRRLNLEL